MDQGKQLFRLGLIAILTAGMAPTAPAAAAASGLIDGGSYRTGPAPQAPVITDLSGDGVADVVVADSGDDRMLGDISVWLGVGAGRLGQRRAYIAGDDPSDVAVLRANTGEAVGLAAADFTGVFILPATGRGSFGQSQYLPIRYTNRSIASEDFNGDGHADMAIADGSSPLSNSVQVVLARPSGGFGAPVKYQLGKPLDQILATDMSGDGKDDLVVVNANARRISILRGRGDGSFLRPESYRSTIAPVRVATGDLNGDRRVDLASEYYSQRPGSTRVDYLGVRLGGAAGRLGPERRVTLGFPYNGLAVGDVTGDDRADLLVGDELGGALAVVPGRGDGAFDRALFYRVSEPIDITTGSLDGDPVDDVVVTQFDDRFKVFLSGGPIPSCRVPTVTGLKLSAARNRVRIANCRTGTVTTRKAPKASRGRVVLQTPATGTAAAAGARVDLVVGR